MNKRTEERLSKTSIWSFKGDDGIVTYYVALSETLVLNIVAKQSCVDEIKIIKSLDDAISDIDLKFGKKINLVPNAEDDLVSEIISLTTEIDTMTRYHAKVYAELLKGDTIVTNVTEPVKSISPFGYAEPPKYNTALDVTESVKSVLSSAPELSETKPIPPVEHKLSDDEKTVSKFISNTVSVAETDLGVSVESLYKLYKAESYSHDITYNEFVNALSAVIKSPMRIKKGGDSIKHILECARMSKLSKTKTLHAAKMYIASHFIKSSKTIQVKRICSNVRNHINGDLSNAEIRGILEELNICNANDKFANGYLISNDAIIGDAKKCEEMRNIYRDPSVTINDIAIMYGLSYGETYAIIKNKTHIRKRRKFDWEKIQNFISSHTDMSIPQIAKELEISPAVLYKAGGRGDVNFDMVKVRRGRKGGNNESKKD